MAKVQVQDADSLKVFRGKLLKFYSTGIDAVESHRNKVRSLVNWLQNEQVTVWKEQLRKREEKVVMAKNDLQRAIMEAQGAKKTFLDEKKALAKAQERHEEAVHKLKRIKKWILELERESDKILGPVLALQYRLRDDQPKAIGRLDHHIKSLEDYLNTSSGAES